MKKIILSLLCLCLSASLCGKGKYTISGTLPDSSRDGRYAVLMKERLGVEEGNLRIDSVRIENGRFLFRGKAREEPFLAHIDIGRGVVTRLIVEPGDIRVDVTLPKYKGSASGTPANDRYDELIAKPHIAWWQAWEGPNSLRTAGLEAGTWTTDDELEFWRGNHVKEEANAQEKKIAFIEEYVHAPAVVESSLFPFIQTGDTTAVAHILAQLPEASRRRLYREKARFDSLMAKYVEEHGPIEVPQPKQVFSEGKAPGNPYTDFTAEATDGQPIALSDIVRSGKLILLDFWASWCIPCLREMPNIASLHDEYKDRGLVVVGISSDRKTEAWKAAIEKNGMSWLQLREGEAQGNAGEVYGVKSIPHTILIDHNGEIVARGLRESELREKVESLLGKQ